MWKMENRILLLLALVIVALCLVVAGVWFVICQPTFTSNSSTKIQVSPKRLEGHVTYLSRELYPRNYISHANLSKAVMYIQQAFVKAGAEVRIQEYEVAGATYKNIRAFYGKGKNRKIIVGAHYDSYAETPGADDNASGIAGLLELAQLLSSHEIDREVELVAYCLEEPPFFGTKHMGSMYHASAIKEEQKKIEGVIVLEMIGYFSEEKGSQEYPLGFLKLFYPDRGNFIAIVGKLDQRNFTKKVKKAMKGVTDIPVYSINAPSSLPGIDLSDHRSYWSYNFESVMITDTAFYRNKGYHNHRDTYDTLNYSKMAKVVASIFETLKTL